MNRIHYCGRWEAMNFTSEKPWIAISITDPRSPIAELQPANCQAVLRLAFWDLDKPMRGHEELFLPRMARDVILFVSKWAKKVDTVLVQCEAGISRSAAVSAFLAKTFLGEDDSPYFIRSIPNMLVYRTLEMQWERRMLREAPDDAQPVVKA